MILIYYMSDETMERIFDKDIIFDDIIFDKN